MIEAHTQVDVVFGGLAGARPVEPAPRQRPQPSVTLLLGLLRPSRWLRPRICSRPGSTATAALTSGTTTGTPAATSSSTTACCTTRWRDVGQLGVLVPASGVLGGCSRLVCRREWGAPPRGPSITFAGTAPFIMMVGGTYPFMAGMAAALGAGAACSAGARCRSAPPCSLTLAFSPLSFSLLCAVLAGCCSARAPAALAPATARRLRRCVVVFLVGVRCAARLPEPRAGTPTTWRTPPSCWCSRWPGCG